MYYYYNIFKGNISASAASALALTSKGQPCGKIGVYRWVSRWVYSLGGHDETVPTLGFTTACLLGTENRSILQNLKYTRPG